MNMIFAMAIGGLLLSSVAFGSGYLVGGSVYKRHAAEAQSNINEQAAKVGGAAVVRLERLRASQDARLKAFEMALPDMIPVNPACDPPQQAVDAYNAAVAP